MRSRLRRFASQLMPAAAQLLLGGSRECELCHRRIHHAAAQPSRSAELPHLAPVIRRLRGLLCARCLEAVPWIREVRCTSCGRAAECPDCVRRQLPQLVLNRAAVQYDQQMKEWLAAYKYRGHERLQRILSPMLDFAYMQLKDQLEAGRIRTGLSAGIRQRTSEPLKPRDKLGRVGDFGYPTPGHIEVERQRQDTAYFRSMASAGSGNGRAGVHGDSSVLATREAARSFSPIVTWVPISEQRMQERGFNQAEQLARALAERHRLHCAPLLRRIRHTERQSHKSRKQRMLDLRDAFSFCNDVVVQQLISDAATYNAILIVDDVYTTGSTLHECARVLQDALPLPIYSITWAR